MSEKTRFRAKWQLALVSAGSIVFFLFAPVTRADDGATIPLPADLAKELEALGKGVVGKAMPALPITDVQEYLNLGPGSWKYKILSGGKAGGEVRHEQYAEMPAEGTTKVWKRTVGEEFVEYIHIQSDHDFGKHLEDDLDVGYSSRFLPGVVWLHKTQAGQTRTIESKIEAFKTGNPKKISFHGKMTSKVSYVGVYEVKTPAGTWPAILVRAEFDIHVGPAKVSDTAYMFFAKGVGKIAEIEATRVSAVLVYHSNTKVVKILTEYPKR